MKVCVAAVAVACGGTTEPSEVGDKKASGGSVGRGDNVGVGVGAVAGHAGFNRGSQGTAAASTGAVLGRGGASAGSQGTAAASTGAVLGLGGATAGSVGAAAASSGAAVGYGGATVGAAGAAAIAGAGGANDCIAVCPLYGAPCCLWAPRCIGPSGSCKLDILKASVDTIYEYADLEQELAAATSEVLVSVSDADVGWAAADPYPAGRIELRLNAEAASRLGSTIEAARYNAFSMTCNGKRLYVGVGYLWYGAAAIKTPVLHVERTDEGQMILRLGAWQGAWMGFTPDATAKQRLDSTAFRAVFCRRGLMHELDPDAKPSKM